MFEINQKSVLASRIIGKGRRILDKFCSFIDLSIPVQRKAFAEHTKNLEKIAFELRKENLLKAAHLTKTKMLQATESTDAIIDLPTCFDRSWNSRGWLAKKGFASAIAENISQVIDIVFKNSTCRLCDDKKLQLKNNVIDNLEYLYWYTSHEENCLYNHQGSPQVSIFKMQLKLVINFVPRASQHVKKRDKDSFFSAPHLIKKRKEAVGTRLNYLHPDQAQFYLIISWFHCLFFSSQRPV